jgi:hypothetical protein
MMIEPTHTRPPAMTWAAPLVLLIVAVGPWPYGFYTLLRLAVFCAAAFLAYSSLAKGSPRPRLGWVFVGLALLYNPVFRVHFDRETWSLINLVSAVPFGVLGWLNRKPST